MLQAILGAPMGIVRILDLLGDPHEVIRNEAVLLLASLTRSSADIQKIAGFEGAFEHILKILACVSVTTQGTLKTESSERAERASAAGPLSLCALIVRARTSMRCFCREEGWASGGVIVQDCLELLLHLLKKNLGNQLMFR